MPHIPESETTTIYPKSKRKVVIDAHGRVIIDSDKDDKDKEELMTELKSTIPDSPLDEILRARYKYISSDSNYFILADFNIDLHDISYANWSLYDNRDDIANDDSSPAILTTRSLKQDFDSMIENENCESQGYETVVSK